MFCRFNITYYLNTTSVAVSLQFYLSAFVLCILHVPAGFPPSENAEKNVINLVGFFLRLPGVRTGSCYDLYGSREFVGKKTLENTDRGIYFSRVILMGTEGGRACLCFNKYPGMKPLRVCMEKKRTDHRRDAQNGGGDGVLIIRSAQESKMLNSRDKG